MNVQLRAELLKLRTTRTAPVLLLAAVGVVLLGVVAQGLSLEPGQLALEDEQRDMFTSASGAMLFATYMGLIAATSEYRYGTIRPNLLIQPRRRVLLVAKLVAAGIVGAAFGAIGAVTSFAGGGPILAARDVAFALGGGYVAALVAGTILGSALCAALGVALGTLVRNQVGAIVALAGWSLAVETVVFATAPGIGRYLPGRASDALGGLTTDHLLSPGLGAAALAVWALALAAVAHRRNEQTDVA